MLLGGSMRSASVTCEARIVTVHISAFRKLASGSSVNTFVPPVAIAECGPLAAHEIVYQPALAFTVSENVMVMFASRPTPALFACGDVAVIAGARSSQLPKADAVLRGLGVE